ncbi:acetyl-CoA carboxylase carboxyltransferase subunit alpha [soil metagenome]
MSTFYQLDFEKPVLELERRIEALETDLRRASAGGVSVGAAGAEAALDDAPAQLSAPAAATELAQSLEALRAERASTLHAIYRGLNPWQTVRVARHPKRPQTRDYIDALCKDFCELHGDRRFGDDAAMVTGFGRVGPHRVLIVGHQKGRTTQEKLACHFGCAHPEGYRKALLKMKLAEKFGVPVVAFVDTQGAYPGIGAEQRGQAEAIAVNLREMSLLKTPIVAIVIGEGGSGGALGIAVADRVAMLQHAWYSVISPEGCAAILWKQANEQTNFAAAKALNLTAADNLRLGIVDDVIEEPVGGAHRDPQGAARSIEAYLLRVLPGLKATPTQGLLDARYARFRKLGSYDEVESVAG